jgi:hypothetical protein
MADEEKEVTMLTDELRAKFAPELTKLKDESFAKGKEEGATAERERIKAVESHSMPGHEQLVAALKFDGKTTGDQAAAKILQAEKEKKTSKLTEIRNGAPAAVEQVPTDAEKLAADKKDDKTKTVDAVALAREAKAYQAEQLAKGNKIEMIEATEFVYKRAGVPTK